MTLYLGTNVVAANGPSRNIGEIIQSTIPLTDAGLHLLDGTLISGGGSYDAFIEYIKDLYDGGTAASSFTTEANWQASNTAYGACGKYVYTPASGGDPATVRLPKRANTHGKLIYSTSSSSGWCRVYEDGWCVQGGVISATGATISVNLIKSYVDTSYIVDMQATYTSEQTSTNNCSYAGVARYVGLIITGNKTVSSFTYQNNGGFSYYWETKGYTDVSGYQQEALYEYIVIATSVKTQIEVDIDQIATDLNGKADKDLTNLTSTATTNFDGQWVTAAVTLVSGGTSYPTSDKLTLDVSSYLPNDNYTYEVILSGSVTTGTTSGNSVQFSVFTDVITDSVFVTYARTRTTANNVTAGTVILPVDSGRKVYVKPYSNATGTFLLALKGYRRIGTNS